MKDLQAIATIDKKYSDLIKLKVHALVIKDPFELMGMVDDVYNCRSNDIKLAIYYLDLAFKHKNLVEMTKLRDQLLILIQDNENISTCEYVDALDLIYRIYAFQGKFRQSLEILDRIISLMPELPKDYDLIRIRKLIHCNRDETSEDTEVYNINVRPVPLLDFSQIENLNITKLIMKDPNSARQNRSLLSDQSPDRKIKTNRDIFKEPVDYAIHSEMDLSAELDQKLELDHLSSNHDPLQSMKATEEADIDGKASCFEV